MMRNACLLVLSLTIGVYSVALHAAQVSITLFPQVSQKKSQSLALGDIAAISEPSSSDHLELIDRLRALSIHGVDFSKCVITKRDIKRVIDQSGLLADRDFAVYGDKTFISGERRNIGADKIGQIAVDYVRSKLLPRYPSVEVTMLSRKNDYKIPAMNNWRLVPLYMDRGFPSSSVQVIVNVCDNDGKVVAALPVWVKVNISEEVYVAKHDIAANTRLSPEDFLFTHRIVRKTPFQEDSLGDGLEYYATSYIQAGQVLFQDVVNKAPDVMKGDHVWVESSSGPVTVSALAVAESDGNKGETISMRSVSSSMYFSGIVSGRKQVRVGYAHE